MNMRPKRKDRLNVWLCRRGQLVAAALQHAELCAAADNYPHSKAGELYRNDEVMFCGIHSIVMIVAARQRGVAPPQICILNSSESCK